MSANINDNSQKDTGTGSSAYARAASYISSLNFKGTSKPSSTEQPAAPAATPASVISAAPVQPAAANTTTNYTMQLQCWSEATKVNLQAAAAATRLAADEYIKKRSAEQPKPVVAPVKIEPVEFQPLDFTNTELAQIIPANPAEKLTLLQQMLKDAVRDEFCAETETALKQVFDSHPEFAPIKKFLDARYPFVKQGIVMYHLLEQLSTSLKNEKYESLGEVVGVRMSAYTQKFPVENSRDPHDSIYEFSPAHSYDKLSPLEFFTVKRDKKDVTKLNAPQMILTMFIDQFKPIVVLHDERFKKNDGAIYFDKFSDGNVRISWGSAEGSSCQITLSSSQLDSHLKNLKVSHAIQLMGEEPKLTVEEHTRWMVARWIMALDFTTADAKQHTQNVELFKANVASYLQANTKDNVKETDLVDYIALGIRAYTNDEKEAVTPEFKKKLLEALYVGYSQHAKKVEDTLPGQPPIKLEGIAKTMLELLPSVCTDKSDCADREIKLKAYVQSRVFNPAMSEIQQEVIAMQFVDGHPSVRFNQDEHLCPGLPRLTLREYTYWHMAMWMWDVKTNTKLDFGKTENLNVEFRGNANAYLTEMHAKNIKESDFIYLIEQAIHSYATGPDKKRLLDAFWTAGQNYALQLNDSAKAGLYSQKLTDLKTMTPDSKKTDWMATVRDMMPVSDLILETLNISGIKAGMSSARHEAISYVLSTREDKTKGSQQGIDAIDAALAKENDRFLTSLKQKPTETQTKTVVCSPIRHQNNKHARKKKAPSSPAIAAAIGTEALPVGKARDDSSDDNRPVYVIEPLLGGSNSGTMLSLDTITVEDEAALAKEEKERENEKERLAAEEKSKAAALATKRWNSLKRLGEEVSALTDVELAYDSACATIYPYILRVERNGDADQVVERYHQSLEIGFLEKQSGEYKEVRRKFRKEIYLPLAQAEARKALDALKQSKQHADEAVAELVAVGAKPAGAAFDVIKEAEAQIDAPIPENSRKKFVAYVKDCKEHQAALHNAITTVNNQKLSTKQVAMAALTEKIKEVNKKAQEVNGYEIDEDFIRSLDIDCQNVADDYNIDDYLKNEGYKINFDKQLQDKLDQLNRFSLFFNENANTFQTMKTAKARYNPKNLSVEVQKEILSHRYAVASQAHSDLTDKIKRVPSHWYSWFWPSAEVRALKAKRDQTERLMRVLTMMVYGEEPAKVDDKDFEKTLLDFKKLNSNLKELDKKIAALGFFDWTLKAFYVDVRKELIAQRYRVQLIDKLETHVLLVKNEYAKADIIRQFFLPVATSNDNSQSVYAVVLSKFSDLFDGLKTVLNHFVEMVEMKSKLKDDWEKRQPAKDSQENKAATDVQEKKIMSNLKLGEHVPANIASSSSATENMLYFVHARDSVTSPLDRRTVAVVGSFVTK